MGFDFKIAPSPHALLQEVLAKNKAKPNRHACLPVGAGHGAIPSPTGWWRTSRTVISGSRGNGRSGAVLFAPAFTYGVLQ